MPVEPTLEAGAAIELLRELKGEAADPYALYRLGETAQTSWKSRVLSVLANSLGSDAELTGRMRANRYGLMAFTDSTPDSAWKQAFASGVETAVGYIDAAIFELSLLDESRRRHAAQISPGARSATADAGEEATEPDKRQSSWSTAEPGGGREFDFLRTLWLPDREEPGRAAGRPRPMLASPQGGMRPGQSRLVLMTPTTSSLRPHLMAAS